ncbi:DUF6438 domain-containing protein [Sphingomonas jatrophae]|uniref:DUF6438 domain-containing protein n=1 Tax=Sphingomonas jatrophae TaxID=1166337 RepID=A0A1I6JXX8_9SPHN|nr:DUF6438 domain-containing protein [Sphingomonas jatrophae]SFR83824.1 hypothetical protein SAMN05192580_1058 [Sphingomonas jatrophae]
MSGRALVGAVLLALCACAAQPGRVDAGHAALGTIEVAVGPCFGFCPVFDAAIEADGTVTFTGRRHTALLGVQQREAGADAYRALDRDLAPFRPQPGTEARVPCDAALADTPSYTIRWSDAAGQATATHQGGCPSGPGHELDAVLRDLPKRLGIENLAKQTTRPGESRG